MRDPARIKKILNKLEEAWTMYPDLRFFQFMSYLLTYTNEPVTEDLFFLEEHDFEKLIDNFITYHGKE